MTIVRQYRIGGSGGTPQGGGNPFGLIGGLIMGIAIIAIGFIVMKGIFTLLFWLSPLLLIAGIAVDPKSALSTAKSLVNMSKKNPLIPIGAIGLSVLFFPTVPGIIVALVGTFLLVKAVVKKKIKTVFNQHKPVADEEAFVDYEEVTEDDDFLELPSAQPEVVKKGSDTNEYDNMF